MLTMEPKQAMSLLFSLRICTLLVSLGGIIAAAVGLKKQITVVLLGGQSMASMHRIFVRLEQSML